MTTYCKICIVCSKKFYCVKISTAMCSRKCRNRARYLPKQLLANLIKRNSNFSMVANEFTASVTDRDGNISTLGEVRNATPDNPLGDELPAVIAMAKEEARKRGVQPPRNLTEEDFKLTPRISFTPHIDDTLPDPNDDGINGPPLDIKPSGDKENKVDNSNNQPSANTVHKGIRKIGSK